MTNTQLLSVILVFVVGYVLWEKLVQFFAKCRAERDAQEAAEREEDERLEREEEKNLAVQKEFVIAHEEALNRRHQETLAALERSISAANNLDTSIRLAEDTAFNGYKELQETALAISEGMKALAASLEATKQDTSDSVKLLAGTLAACEAIGKATTDLRDEVEQFRKLVGDPSDKQYPEDNVTMPPSDQQAATFAEILAKVGQGMSLEKATQDAEDMAEKQTMFSAVDAGRV